MIKSCISLLMMATPCLAQDMPVPSGMQTQFVEVILEPDKGIARFRFIAPELGKLGFELADISDDFGWLCEQMALPALRNVGWEADQIVVSISDRVVPFGESNSDAVQYFDGYSIDGDMCLWEPF